MSGMGLLPGRDARKARACQVGTVGHRQAVTVWAGEPHHRSIVVSVIPGGDRRRSARGWSTAMRWCLPCPRRAAIRPGSRWSAAPSAARAARTGPGHRRLAEVLGSGARTATSRSSWSRSPPQRSRPQFCAGAAGRQSEIRVRGEDRLAADAADVRAERLGWFRSAQRPSQRCEAGARTVACALPASPASPTGMSAATSTPHLPPAPPRQGLTAQPSGRPGTTGRP